MIKRKHIINLFKTIHNSTKIIIIKKLNYEG